MKRLLLSLALLLALCVPWTQAQTFLYEGFEGGSMPSGWTTDGGGTWSVVTNNGSYPSSPYAGSYLIKIPGTSSSYVTKLITPTVDCSSKASVTLSFAYTNYPWGSDVDGLKIYYRTSSEGSWTQADYISSGHSSWTEAEYTLPTSNSATFQVAFEMNDNWGRGVCLDEVTIAPAPDCVPLKTITSTTTRTTVTANWAFSTVSAPANCLGYEVKLTSTNDPEATAIQSATINDPTTLTYTFNNLDRETTYYVHVRSNCGNDDGYSAWVSASATTQSLLDCDNPNNVVLVADGTATSAYIPFEGYNYDYSFSKSQFIYSSDMLTSLRGKTLNKLVFFSSLASKSFGGTIEVRIGVTTANDLSSKYEDEPSTVVYSGSLTVANNQWTIDFGTNTFNYPVEGGNLLIQVKKVSSGTWASCNFYGTNDNVSGISRYNSGTTSTFLPKAQFSYCETLEACPAVTVTVPDSTITTTTAVINWTASTADYFGSYDLFISDTAVADLTLVTPNYTGLTATSKTLDTLANYSDYYVYVRVNCNGYGHDDGNAWSEGVHFQTLSPCNVPTNLNVELRSKRSAMLRWTTTAQANNYRYFITDDDQEAPSTPTVSGIYGDSVLIEDLTPGTTYYLYLSNMCGKADGCSPWVPVTFTTPAACLDPDTVYASDIQMYQITLNWEPNQYADPTDAYDVYIDTLQVTDFTSVTPTATGVTGTSYTFDTLFRNTLYYMYVRVNCGEAGANNWIEVAQITDSLAPDCQDQTIANGTNTNNYLPFYGNYMDNSNMRTQFIYDGVSDDENYNYMKPLRGKSINSMKFFTSHSNYNYTATVNVYVGLTSESSLSSGFTSTPSNLVYSGSVSIVNGTVTIPFTSAFDYPLYGGNLIVEFKMVSTGNFSNASFYGVNQSFATGRCSYSSSNNAQYFLPKVEFNACNEAVVCPEVENVTIPAETVLNDQALITWTRGTGDFTSSYNIIVAPYQVTKPDTVFIQKPANVVIDSNLVDTFYLAQGLIADTTYYVYVRVNCKEQPYDDGSSNWKLVEPAFTTEKSCVKPFDFQVTGATSTTMSLQWLNRKNTTNWELGINGSTDIINITDDTCRYTVTNLTPYTQYTYTLRTYCGEGDTSEMVTLPGGSYQRTLNNETNIRVDSIHYLELIPNTIVQDTLNHTITATVRKGSDLTNVYFEYDRSDYVSEVTSSSGNIQGNFGTLNLTTPATLTVVAEDTLITQDWTMTLTEEACATPYNVAAQNVSRRTADLTWNVGDSTATSFDVIISRTEITDFTGLTGTQITATNVDGNCIFSFDTLSRETAYYAYVRTNCGAEYGQWRGTGFTTMGVNDCDTKQVGTGTYSGNSVPFSGYYHNSYSQQVYSASNLNLDSGYVVSSIDFNYYWSTSTTRKIAIYMANAPKGTSVSSGWYSTGLTEVYSAKTTTFTSTNGWQSITLDEPFEYTGGDVVVAMYMIYDACETQYGYSSRFYYTSGAGYARYARNDDADASAMPLNDSHVPTSGNVYTTDRPNIKFTACYSVDVCPEVADLTVSAIQYNAATITWTATGDYPGTSDIYVVTGDTTGLQPTATDITGTSYTATGLSPYTDYYVYVRTHCNGEGQDDGISPWSMTTFKTESECAYPRNVVATVTGKNTAHIEWTDAQGQTPTTENYEYAYSTEEGQPSAAAGTSTTGSADLTGLTSGATYYIYVRKNCGENQSPWIEANAITTPAAMPAPIIEETYDISFNAFKVRWTKDYANYANETEWQYACVAHDSTPSDWTTTNDTTALVYGLTESTPYDFYVRAGNDNDHSLTAMATVNTIANPGDCMTIGSQAIGDVRFPLAYYNYSYSQAIYTASEIGQGGSITSIKYHRVDNQTTALNVNIYMGVKADSTFATTTDWVAENDLTLVHSTGIPTGNANEWVELTLPTPYVYDGTSNLVVAVSAGYNYYSNIPHFYNSVKNGAFMNRASDGDATIKDHPGTNSGYIDDTHRRPDIIFCFEPQTCPKPTHIVVDNITSNSARATWYPGGTETSWNYYVATEVMTDSALNTMAATTTPTLVNSLSGLTRDTDYHLYVQGKCSASDSSKWAHIAFSTLPTCSAPINAVAVSNVDGQITFDAAAGTYGTVGSYDFWYWKDGTTDTVKVNGQTATYVASGVAAGDYHWQVRANCGTTDGMSRWTTGNDVRVCGEYALPYTQGFEEVPITYSGLGMIETICWNDLNADEDGSSTPYYRGYTYSHTEGNRSLMLIQGSVDTLYLILPSFGDAENLSVKFDAAMGNTSAPNRIKVGYFTDITDESTFVPVYTAANNSYWTSNAAYIRNLPSGARLAFSYDDSNYGITSAYLDNIRVDTISLLNLATSVSPDANLGTVEMTCQATDTTADGRFYEGSTPTLTATPNAGFKFSGWSNGETANPLTVTMESDTNLVANFDTISYQLNVVVSSDPGQYEMGDVTGSGVYKTGSQVTISAIDIDEHYHVLWSDGSTENPHTFPMPAQNTVITAHFDIDTFQVFTAQNVDSMGTVTGAGKYTYGETAAIEATPAAHHHFVQWSDGETNPQRTYAGMKDSTFTAIFRIDTVNITAVSKDVSRGEVTGAPGWVNYGTTVTLNVSEIYPYAFKRWSDNTTDTPYVFTATQDSALIAYFNFNDFTVTVSSNNNNWGTVTGDGTFLYGETDTITATPNVAGHYHFVNWSNGVTSNPYYHVVTNDTAIQGNFAIDQHRLNAVTNDATMGSVTGAGVYDYGTIHTITATPAANYHFVNWSNDVFDSTTTVNLTSDTTIVANFAIDRFNVSATANDPALGRVTGGLGDWDYGTEVTLTAVPMNDHVRFTGWSDGDTARVRSIIVNSDVTLTANFALDRHILSVWSGIGGTVSSGSTYDHGDTAYVWALPDDHYHFTGWTDGNMNPAFYVVMDNNYSFTATFAKDQHVVTTNVNNNAAGTVSGAGTYNYGDTAILTATPNAHYEFVQWSNGSTDTTINVVLAGDTTLTAIFARDEHTVTVNNNNPDMGTVAGGSVYTHGDMATITATAFDHYHFTGWSSGEANTSYSILVTDDYADTANFAKDRYVVTTGVNNSSLGSVTGAGTYDYETQVTVTAVPQAHVVFTGWNDGDTNRVRTFTLTADTMFTANFIVDTHVISVVNNNPTMGSVSGGNTYNHGDMATISATANDHYHFTGWSSGEANTSYSIQVTDNYADTANFAIDRHVATILSADDATGTVTGGDTYDYGATVTATVTPAANYHFLQWSNGSTANPYTFTLTSDTMLVATFTIDTLNVTVLANDDSLGTVTGTGRYTYGEQATLTATPIDHYHVAGWSNGMTGDVITITVTSDSTVTAIFEIDTFFVTGNVIGVGEINGLGVYNYGDTAMLVASQTDDNYTFAGWTGDTTGIEFIYDLSSHILVFVVTRDVELTATFNYVPTSVDDAENVEYVAFTEGMDVVVNGVEDHTVAIYDMTGKLVKIVKEAQDVERFSVNAAGVYLVRIDNKTTLRVVVK